MVASQLSVGLVLGAGGIAGAAWHAGVLAALEERGWDARTADLIVGTSAGAGTAAQLRVGVPATDLYASSVGDPMSEIGQAYMARAGGPLSGFPAAASGPRFPFPASPALAMRSLSRPWRFRPGVAAAGILPAGRVPTGALGDRIRANHDQLWPEAPTWICAVRMSDGERVVFGRDVFDAHLATAVEASSAVPGFFAPVEFAGDDYVDGAVHSPTNADLVADLGFDLVVVSSPMSATRQAIVRPAWSGARGLHAMTLNREVRAIRDAGVPVLVFQPGPDVVDVIGLSTMDPARRRDIAMATYQAMDSVLAIPALADDLARLCG